MSDDQLKQDLTKYRQDIDRVDDDIVALLEKRAALATAVGEKKREHGVKTYAVLEREAEIVNRMRGKSQLLTDSIPFIYNEIISACLACEQPVRAGYLGPPGTFSHHAAKRFFGRSAEFIAAATISDAIQMAEKGTLEFAVVPFENSTAGVVGETMDNLVTTTEHLVGESILPIHHCLMTPAATAAAATQLADIKTVYAHPQPLEQCRRWLAENLPRAALHAQDSSAAAAEKIIALNAPDAAAITSPFAADLYPLSALAENIEDYANNSTRFVILGKRPLAPSGKDKTSFIVSVATGKQGALYRLLEPLVNNDINMTKLESRPTPGLLWEYMFFIDIEGHQQDEKIKRGLDGVKERAAFLKILGSYPVAS